MAQRIHPGVMPVSVFALSYFLSFVFRSTNAVLGQHLEASFAVSQEMIAVLTSTFFLSLGLAQLPLGTLLDRFGPRRVHGVLLCVSCLGALLTAAAPTYLMAVVGRILIGIGVAGGLMAGLKLTVMWFTKDKFPAVNGFYSLIGASGAIITSYPLAVLVTVLSWQAIYIVIALFNLLLVVLTFLLGKERRRERHVQPISLGANLRGIRDIAFSLRFWHFVPYCVLCNAVFLSFYTFWVTPYLQSVHLVSNGDLGYYLAGLAVGQTLGYGVLGYLATALSGYGISLAKVAIGSMLCFQAIQLLIAVTAPTAASDTGQIAVFLLWSGFGFFGSGCLLFFALAIRLFPTTQTGRVTTVLNTIIFVFSFFLQAGMGYALSALSRHYDRLAFPLLLMLLIGLQLLGLGFMLKHRKDYPIENKRRLNNSVNAVC